MIKEITGRSQKENPEILLRTIFEGQIRHTDIVDAIFTDGRQKGVIGVSGLPMKVPATFELLKNHEIASYILEKADSQGSILICLNGKSVKMYIKHFNILECKLPKRIEENVLAILSEVEKWAGVLNEQGEHEIDLFAPVPGPHFCVNLLMGNRIDYPYPLQTMPKSVVDRLGGGSFRSHAATQVLASRWDMRQEENGFPANRQFYIIEDNQKIFYSAELNRNKLVSASCKHSQNYTNINYITTNGLNIGRLIFILPQMEGLPLATEVQRIEITNNGLKPRSFKLVYTGMFGSAVPNALFEDVLYSNIVMQSRILKNEDETVLALSPDYCPQAGRTDLRFHTMLTHNRGKVGFIKEFCTNYNEFLGNGTLQEPDGLLKLSNNVYRKGPGFFAVATEFSLDVGEKCYVDQFTGIVSNKGNSLFSENSLQEEVGRLISVFSKPEEINKAFEENNNFLVHFSRFMQVQTQNEILNTYINKNLPFQVLYQTFVSRSFCQTQKGYREIGFREIQDIYASMFYFIGMGKADFVKRLIKEWCGMIFEFGYAYHNFYWKGKEPGKWSDDQLWFVQAIYRYINLTGDIAILNEDCVIAGAPSGKTRPIYDTLKAIIQYSAKISVGKHGLPLLDYADWNDCLKLDTDYINGITKEKIYRQQVENGGEFGDAFKSDYSESVMNAFLLKVTIDQMMELAYDKGDFEYHNGLGMLRRNLKDNIQKHAWKGDFFTRVLFNRYKNDEYQYLGAKGDKLSADKLIDGTYFLNSFSWSILSDCASESQIKTMLDVLELRLKTPFGLKLVSPVDLGKISDNSATNEYFPGDRENGGVFKHACMMAVVAMFKAAKNVSDTDVALRLSRLGYWLIDVVLPYKTMGNPYVICGNPRFCTQYNNSETGENIGPMLSGTSSWLTLAIVTALGIDYNMKGITFNPILREEELSLSYILNLNQTSYNVNITKPYGFYRIIKNKTLIRLDNVILKDNIIPILDDNKEHQVTVVF